MKQKTNPLYENPIFKISPFENSPFIKYPPTQRRKKNMKQKKTYWQCITRNSTGDILTTIWHGTESAIATLVKRYDFIIPLDRKPRNCTDIKEA